jgi:cation transport ATPase
VRLIRENCVLNLKNKSHSVTAEIEVPTSGAQGVIAAQGANIGGWSFYKGAITALRARKANMDVLSLFLIHPVYQDHGQCYGKAHCDKDAK